MTFDTAFKRVYAEELASYGFKKIKGKRCDNIFLRAFLHIF
jgi:hypothetical protein